MMWNSLSDLTFTGNSLLASMGSSFDHSGFANEIREFLAYIRHTAFQFRRYKMSKVLNQVTYML